MHFLMCCQLFAQLWPYVICCCCCCLLPQLLVPSVVQGAVSAVVCFNPGQLFWCICSVPKKENDQGDLLGSSLAMHFWNYSLCFSCLVVSIQIMHDACVAVGVSRADMVPAVFLAATSCCFACRACLLVCVSACGVARCSGAGNAPAGKQQQDTNILCGWCASSRRYPIKHKRKLCVCLGQQHCRRQ